MGTRSLTYVYHAEEPACALICMYRQYDGELNGHGAALARFLIGIKIVNGIIDFKAKIANGAECLAAQIVAHFKDGPGGIYCMSPIEPHDAGQEYVYRVYANESQQIRISVESMPYRGEPTVLFDGTPKELRNLILGKKTAVSA